MHWRVGHVTALAGITDFTPSCPPLPPLGWAWKARYEGLQKKQTTALGHLAALKKVEAQLSSFTKLLEEAALAKAAREEKKELSHLEARPQKKIMC